MFYRVDASWVDDDDLCTMLFSRVFGSLPEDIPVPGPTSAPEEDTPGVRPNHGEDTPPEKGVTHHAKRTVADLPCPRVIGRSQEVEEPLPDFIMGPARAARSGNSLWAMLFNDLFQSIADLGKGIIP